MLLLAISGSLRKKSSNTFLLETAQKLSPPEINIELYSNLGNLPHFNPDDDASQFLEVINLIEKVKNANGIIFSTPEYAHGIPGSLKNGLDWLVGSDAFIKKPFTLFNTSSRSSYGHQSLIEILKTMSGIWIENASITIPLLGQADYSAILNYSDCREKLLNAINIFAKAIENSSKPI